MSHSIAAKWVRFVFFGFLVMAGFQPVVRVGLLLMGTGFGFCIELVGKVQGGDLKLRDGEGGRIL